MSEASSIGEEIQQLLSQLSDVRLFEAQGQANILLSSISDLPHLLNRLKLVSGVSAELLEFGECNRIRLIGESLQPLVESLTDNADDFMSFIGKIQSIVHQLAAFAKFDGSDKCVIECWDAPSLNEVMQRIQDAGLVASVINNQGVKSTIRVTQPESKAEISVIDEGKREMDINDRILLRLGVPREDVDRMNGLIPWYSIHTIGEDSVAIFCTSIKAKASEVIAIMRKAGYIPDWGNDNVSKCCIPFKKLVSKAYVTVIDETKCPIQSAHWNNKINAQPKACWVNAVKVLKHSNGKHLKYVEGFATMKDHYNIPFEHGWLEADDGTIIDPTLPSHNIEYFPGIKYTLDEVLALGKGAKPPFVWGGVNGWGGLRNEAYRKASEQAFSIGFGKSTTSENKLVNLILLRLDESIPNDQKTKVNKLLSIANKHELSDALGRCAFVVHKILRHSVHDKIIGDHTAEELESYYLPILRRVSSGTARKWRDHYREKSNLKRRLDKAGKKVEKLDEEVLKSVDSALIIPSSAGRIVSEQCKLKVLESWNHYKPEAKDLFVEGVASQLMSKHIFGALVSKWGREFLDEKICTAIRVREAELYGEATGICEDKSKFHQPENWEEIDHGKDWELMVGANDWECEFTWMAVYFDKQDHDSERIWVEIDNSQFLTKDNEVLHKNEKLHKEWGYRAYKTWINTAKKISKEGSGVSMRSAFYDALSKEEMKPFIKSSGKDSTTWDPLKEDSVCGSTSDQPPQQPYESNLQPAVS